MADLGYRQCKRCSVEKAEDEFYQDRNRKDGLRAECKVCVNEMSQEWARANPEKRRVVRSDWQKRNPGYQAIVRSRHPEKYKARTDLNNALKLGKIVKPADCEECGEPTESRQLHGHHEDYSRPLDVAWLCRSCHRGRHKLGEKTKT